MTSEAFAVSGPWCRMRLVPPQSFGAARYSPCRWCFAFASLAGFEPRAVGRGPASSRLSSAEWYAGSCAERVAAPRGGARHVGFGAGT